MEPKCWTVRNSYFLCLMSVGYVIGEIAHFLIITTSRSVARELHYGDKGCYDNTTFPKEKRNLSQSCESHQNESLCLEASISYLAIMCTYRIIKTFRYFKLFNH